MPIPKISFPGRLIYAAVSGTLNNRNKFRSFGAISALRSPQNREITKNLDPQLDDSGMVSGVTDGGKVIPTIQYEYDPKVAWGGSAAYTDIGTGAAVAQPLTATFAINKIRQANPILVKSETWRLLEKDAERYKAQLLDSSPVNFGAAVQRIAALSSAQEVARSLRNTMETSFFAPMETNVINALNTGAGKNPLYPASAAGDAISITLMNADDSITVKLEDDMANLQAWTKSDGTWIILAGTGSKVATYFRRVLKSSNTDTGIQLGAMIKASSVEFYQSEYIDAVLGANHFFIIAPGCAAIPVIQEFRYLEGQKINDYTFASLTMPAFDFTMDLRMKEFTHQVRKDGANVDFVDPHPYITLAPSLRYNIWTKPQGFHYADTADPLYAYNGILHYVAQ